MGKKRHKKQNKNPVGDPRLHVVELKIRHCLIKTEELKASLAELNKRVGQQNQMASEIKQIETDYRKRGALEFLKVNSKYRDLKANLNRLSPEAVADYKKKLSQRIANQENLYRNYTQELNATREAIAKERAVREKLEQELHSKRLKEKNAQEAAKAKALKEEALNRELENKYRKASEIVTCVIASNEISIAWKDISFGDGYVIFRYRGRVFRKYIKESKKYLNEIKAHYSSRNVPEIRAQLSGGEISRILNAEVLFYHIEFLTDCGTLFDKSYRITSVKKWDNYNKNYYNRHLKFAFESKCLAYLCDISHPTLPIIPTGELFKTTSGSSQIHPSFLFPIESRNGLKLIWESTEESKASYIFACQQDFFESAQSIYDYIVGETINKRETLIRSTSLQKQLRLDHRVRHASFNDWHSEINSFRKT